MISPAELIQIADGTVYHLKLRSGQVADKIILVGDQERVSKFAEFFETVELSTSNREFVCKTGIIKGQRISVISTGIGTDNIDIVLNELDMLFNLDWEKKIWREDPQSIKLLRLGTCGAIQSNIPVGSVIHSRFALGRGGMMHTYQRKPDHLRQTLEAEAARFWQNNPNSENKAYAALCSLSFHTLIQERYPEIYTGITYTAEGFYGAQGRQVGRIPIATPDLTKRIASFSFRDMRMLNMEMETAGILGMAQELGYEAASLSVALVNRRTGAVSDNPAQEIKDLIKKGIEIMLAW